MPYLRERSLAHPGIIVCPKAARKQHRAAKWRQSGRPIA
jgi:hypothetical protein